MFSRWDFKNLLHDGYVDIIQPDLSHAGGITECKKIFSMAEAYDVAVAPHCPLGPIALAACLQVDATAHNAFIQEQSLGIHYNQGNDLLDYVKDPAVFSYSQGHVSIPQGPGLGIEINEQYVRKMAKVGHDWKNPVWRHQDGSVAEWYFRDRIGIPDLLRDQARRRCRGFQCRARRRASSVRPAATSERPCSPLKSGQVRPTPLFPSKGRPSGYSPYLSPRYRRQPGPKPRSTVSAVSIRPAYCVENARIVGRRKPSAPGPAHPG